VPKLVKTGIRSQETEVSNKEQGERYKVKGEEKKRNSKK
jgi:hypothetical protein